MPERVNSLPPATTRSSPWVADGEHRHPVDRRGSGSTTGDAPARTESRGRQDPPGWSPSWQTPAITVGGGPTRTPQGPAQQRRDSENHRHPEPPVPRSSAPVRVSAPRSNGRDPDDQRPTNDGRRRPESTATWVGPAAADATARPVGRDPSVLAAAGSDRSAGAVDQDDGGDRTVVGLGRRSGRHGRLAGAATQQRRLGGVAVDVGLTRQVYPDRTTSSTIWRSTMRSPGPVLVAPHADPGDRSGCAPDGTVRELGVRGCT